jgi:hypothetical protein
VFDYARYRTEIVPALVTLLRTGVPEPWLAEVFRAEPPDGYGWSRMAFASTDLVAHCDWLGDDLRYLGGRPSGLLSLACTSGSCPERHHCVFQQDRPAVEELNALYEALVATRCLGPGQFVGRSRTPYGYQAVLDRLAVPAGDRVRELLAGLGSRGAGQWGHDVSAQVWIEAFGVRPA